MASPNLVPMVGYVLVRLGDKYEHLKGVSTRSYEAKNRGVAIMTDEEHEYLINKTVYWDQQVEGAPITKGGQDYMFIFIDDIQGYENGKQS